MRWLIRRRKRRRAEAAVVRAAREAVLDAEIRYVLQRIKGLR